MKNIRIVHGTLMYPLEVGSRALIYEEGRYLHTSKVIAIHGVTPTSSGTSTLVTSGSWYDVPIPSSFQAASKSVSLYCKGHIPWIDCKISGYWNVH